MVARQNLRTYTQYLYMKFTARQVIGHNSHFSVEVAHATMLWVVYFMHKMSTCSSFLMFDIYLLHILLVCPRIIYIIFEVQIVSIYCYYMPAFFPSYKYSTEQQLLWLEYNMKFLACHYIPYIYWDGGKNVCRKFVTAYMHKLISHRRKCISAIYALYLHPSFQISRFVIE